MTGTKTLAADNSHAAFCATNPAGVFVIISNVALTYTATINGAQQTTGPATVSMSGVQGTGELGFTESFGSTSVVQKQCKHGGWKSFGTRFKNQGDCVTFFATGVKNPPSGS